MPFAVMWRIVRVRRVRERFVDPKREWKERGVWSCGCVRTVNQRGSCRPGAVGTEVLIRSRNSFTSSSVSLSPSDRRERVSV